MRATPVDQNVTTSIKKHVSYKCVHFGGKVLIKTIISTKFLF